MRTKKAVYNTITSMCYELVNVICGLILPRLILSRFGSSYNGITSSIVQFISCAVLLRAGVSFVTRAALYGPLSRRDYHEISAIVLATEKFMRKIAIIYVIGLVGIAALYPLLVSEEFEWFFTFSLVLIIGSVTFVQYYFGITYQFLLQADQSQYIISCVQIFTVILNTIISAILIQLGFGIHSVKLVSAVAYSLNPIVICLHCKKKYRIDRSVQPSPSAIKQRWDAFSQALAVFVHNNTDIIILTCFAETKEVSVYAVYNYVIKNLQAVLQTFIDSFGAAFGNMLANKETKTIEQNLRVYELIVFGLTSVLYSVAGVMIVPFAEVYTMGVNDVNYTRPLFAMLITISGAFACFRLPYQTIVQAAGHFKQTKTGALIEAGMNITISVLAVYRFGLVGVAVGTLVATVFRSVQYAVYLGRHIVPRSITIFIGHMGVNAIVAAGTYIVSCVFLPTLVDSWTVWIVAAVKITICTCFLSAGLHLLFYSKDIKVLIRKLIKKSSCS